jgi:hypothetical protein
VHLVYELVLTNTSPTPATLKKIEVVDGSNPSKTLTSYDGRGLLSRLRTMGRLTAENSTIEFNSTRLFLIDLSLDPAIALPQHLIHHIDVLGAPSPGPKPTAQVLLSYAVAPLDISRKLPVIGAPLSGKGWVAVNGCCGADSIHGRAIFRSTAESILPSASRLTGCGWMTQDGSCPVMLQTCTTTTVTARMC